jgi:hypothetical protein
VDQHGQGLGGLTGPATRHGVGNVKSLQSRDGAENQRHDDAGHEHGDGDLPELLPTAGAIHFGGFIKRLRDHLQTSQQNQGHERRCFPDHRQANRGERPVRFEQPAGGLTLKAQTVNHIVDNAVLGVKKPSKNQTCKRQRQRPRQEQRQTHRPLALEGQIGQHGQRQPGDQGAWHRDQGDQQGVFRGVPEQGVLHDIEVVLQPQESPVLVHRVQAVVDQLANRVDHDHQQQQKCGGQQHDRKRLLTGIS